MAAAAAGDEEVVIDTDTYRNTLTNYTGKNLETRGVLELADSTYVFVHEEHPVISLLKSNKKFFGIDLDKNTKMDNEWYKLTTPLMASCCNTLRSKVFEH